MSRSGPLSCVVLALLLGAACSSSDSKSVAPSAIGSAGSPSNGSGGASEGGHAGVATGGAGGASANAAGSETAGASTAGASAGENDDGGPLADASRPSDAAGAIDSGRGNKILIYTNAAGFVHASIPAAAAAISKAATAKGLVPEQSKDTGKFVPAQLAQYAAIVLLATSGDAFGTPGTTQIQTLIDFVRGGGGLVAIEDANHAYDNSVPYVSLIGGDFNGHSAFGPDTCYKDGNHPSVVMLPVSFAVTDEIYYFTKFAADNQVVLRCGADKRPISWVRSEGAGRVFYTALGHADASWTSPPLVDGHVIPALMWTLGR